ncbi:MAG: regulatory protein RecX [Atopobiaceae bacterium]
MTSHANDGASLQWDVQLASRKGLSQGPARPRGKLIVDSDAGGHEEIALPSALARTLHKKMKDDDLHPSSRAELLYEVGRISQDVARKRLAGLLDRRDYSAKEASDKLRMDGFAPQVVQRAVERACAAGLIDDRRFGDSFVRSKLYSGWGLNRIQRELMRRGVDVAELPGWPYEYANPEDEPQRAYEAASRKVVSGKNQFQKMVRFLVGRGFSMGASMDAARKVMDERQQDDCA